MNNEEKKRYKKYLRKQRRKDRINKSRILFLTEKYPNIDSNIILEIYQIALNAKNIREKTAEELKKEENNLNISKSFIEGVFLSGVQVGLMKKQNEN
jgi:2C-methyl-D-erythritol 2,4-cyclodiphosphate synthase